MNALLAEDETTTPGNGVARDDGRGDQTVAPVDGEAGGGPGEAGPIDAAGEDLLRARIRRPAPGSVEWVSICPLEWIVPDSGVAALLGDEQIAVFRLGDDGLYALANLDPFSGAHVLARGLVGDRGGRPCVFSPMYKHAFSLESGTCVDQPDVYVSAYPVRLVGGIVFVGRWL